MFALGPTAPRALLNLAPKKKVQSGPLRRSGINLAYPLLLGTVDHTIDDDARLSIWGSGPKGQEPGAQLAPRGLVAPLNS